MACCNNHSARLDLQELTLGISAVELRQCPLASCTTLRAGGGALPLKKSLLTRRCKVSSSNVTAAASVICTALEDSTSASTRGLSSQGILYSPGGLYEPGRVLTMGGLDTDHSSQLMLGRQACCPDTAGFMGTELTCAALICVCCILYVETRLHIASAILAYLLLSGAAAVPD